MPHPEWEISNGVWEMGKPTSGPGNAYFGSQCAGTVLGGNYPDNKNSRLISPAFHLPVVGVGEVLQLRFWQWYSYAYEDRGYVQISVWNEDAWGDWVTLLTSAQQDARSDWSRVGVDLTAYADQRVRIAFYHVESNSYVSSGWYIDGVEIWQGIPKLEPLEGFESGWEDWYTDHGVWQVGAPTTGPGSAYEGSSAAGTNLGGNYPDNTDSRLISPAFDLPVVGVGEVLQLRFWQWYSYAYEDRGYVQISVWNEDAWGDWVTLLTSAQQDARSDWSRVGVDLTAYADQRVRIAFYHVESNSYVSSGWYIDGVEIWQGIPKLEPLEGFESGWGDWFTDHGVWEVGVPVVGPSGAYEGNAVAGTNLDGSYPDDDTDSRLISPAFDLPVVGVGEVLQLRFWQWYSYAYEDRGDVQISAWDGNAWSGWVTLLNSAQRDANSGWSRVGVDLTAYADQRVRIAFYHVESNSYVSSGWYIDGVEIWQGDSKA